jgi:hypothetical protein
MSGSLLPDDDHRLRHLHDQVLPWMIGGLRARRQWFVYVARIHAYGTEALTIVAGLGFGGFGNAVIGQLQGVPRGNAGTGQNLIRAMQEALGPAFLVGIVAAISWLVLRLVVSQQDVRQRALFAIDCSTGMEVFMHDLYVELEKPRPDIAKIQLAVNAKAREAITHHVWPWRPPSPNQEDIALELARQTNYIRTTYMARWAPRDREPPE